jgi:hypothetical protein
VDHWFDLVTTLKSKLTNLPAWCDGLHSTSDDRESDEAKTSLVVTGVAIGISNAPGPDNHHDAFDLLVT